jgi:tetratricopeptide (TPR) repeat protein
MAGSRRSAARRFKKWRQRRARRQAAVLIAVSAICVAAAFYLFAPLTNQSPDQSLQKAMMHRQSGEFAATIIELKNALQKDPTHTASRVALGKTYLQVSDFISAEKELRRALELGAPAGEVLAPLARSLLFQEKYQQLLLDVVPDGLLGLVQADVYTARGRAFFGLNRLTEARQSFREALKIAPQHADALIETARLEIEQNYLAEANLALQRLRALLPENLETVALQGDAYLRIGQYSEAANRYQEVLAQLPDHLLTQVALAEVLIRQGKDRPAETLINRALQQAPNNLDANYFSALLAIKKNEFARALKHAERALFVDANHIPSLVLAGAAAFALGQEELAELNLKKAVAQDPDLETATQLLSALRAQRGANAITGFVRARPNQKFMQLLDDTATPALIASAIDAQARKQIIIQVGFSYSKALWAIDNDTNPSDLSNEDLAALHEILNSDVPDQALVKLQEKLSESSQSIQARALLAEYFLKHGQTADLLEADLNRLGANHVFLVSAAIVGLTDNRAAAALRALQHLKEQQLPSAELDYLLAEAHRKLGNEDAYEIALKQSLAIYPRYAPALADRIRNSLGEGRLDDAERDLQALQLSWSEHPAYFDLAAGVALVRGDYAAAARMYKKAFEAGSTRVRVQRLAYAYNKAGAIEESQNILAAWLANNKDDIAVALALANKHMSSGDLVEAAELYAVVLRQNPDHVVALNNMAWVSLQLGEAAIAEQYARHGHRMAPDDVDLIDTLAEVYLARQEYSAARALLEPVTRIESSDPNLRIKFARSLVQLGEHARAVNVLQQTLGEYENFGARAEAQRLLAELKR